jgi:hypothetical protein
MIKFLILLLGLILGTTYAVIFIYSINAIMLFYPDTLKQLTEIGQLVSGFIAFLALIFVGWQVRLQRINLALDKRPYLYIDLEPIFNFDGPFTKNIYGGGYVHYKNVGKTPASEIQLEFIVSSNELRAIDLKKWFLDYYGDFPDVQTVFPEDNQKIYIHPCLGSKKTKLFYLGVLIKYKGVESNKTYWYKLRQLYTLNCDDFKGTVNVTPISTYTDWDKNINFNPLKLEDCDFDKHLNFKAFIPASSCTN